MSGESGRMPAGRRRPSVQGVAILQELRGQRGFWSAQDIYAALRGAGQRVGLATVYRRLRTLTDDGLVEAVPSPDGRMVFRIHDADESRHRLVCRRCGISRIVEGGVVDLWAVQAARRLGFSDVDTALEIHGMCPRCSDSSPES